MRESLLKEAKHIEKASKESPRIQASAEEYREKAHKIHVNLQTEYKRVREKRKEACWR
jgi:hypothetical protein